MPRYKVELRAIEYKHAFVTVEAPDRAALEAGLRTLYIEYDDSDWHEDSGGWEEGTHAIVGEVSGSGDPDMVLGGDDG